MDENSHIWEAGTKSKITIYVQIIINIEDDYFQLVG